MPIRHLPHTRFARANRKTSVSGGEVTSGLIHKMYAPEIEPSFLTGDVLSGYNDLSTVEGDGTAAGTGDLTLVPNQINSLPVVNFPDAAFFTFPEITGIKTVIWIGKESATIPTNCALFGHSVTFNNARASVTAFANYAAFKWEITTNNVKWVYAKFKLNGKHRSPHKKVLPTDAYQILTAVNTVGAEADNLAADRELAARVWEGDLLLWKAFNRELSDEEIWQETQYWSGITGLTVSNEGTYTPWFWDGDSIGLGLSSTLTNNSFANLNTSGTTVNCVGGKRTQTLIDDLNDLTIPLTEVKFQILIGTNDVLDNRAETTGDQSTIYNGLIADLFAALNNRAGFDSCYIFTLTKIDVSTASAERVEQAPFNVLWDDELIPLAALDDKIFIIDGTVLDGTISADYVDGTHPSAQGYAKLHDEAVTTVNAFLE